MLPAPRLCAEDDRRCSYGSSPAFLSDGTVDDEEHSVSASDGDVDEKDELLLRLGGRCDGEDDVDEELLVADRCLRLSPSYCRTACIDVRGWLMVSIL